MFFKFHCPKAYLFEKQQPMVAVTTSLNSAKKFSSIYYLLFSSIIVLCFLFLSRDHLRLQVPFPANFTNVVQIIVTEFFTYLQVEIKGLIKKMSGNKLNLITWCFEIQSL